VVLWDTSWVESPSGIESEITITIRTSIILILGVGRAETLVEAMVVLITVTMADSIMAAILAEEPVETSVEEALAEMLVEQEEDSVVIAEVEAEAETFNKEGRVSKTLSHYFLKKNYSSEWGISRRR
jgi:hypothetical protein